MHRPAPPGLHHAGPACLAAAVLLSQAGCLAPRTAWVLTLPSPEARPASHIDGVFSYGHAAATTFAIVERDFGFAPFPVSIEFLPDEKAFEAALLGSGYSAGLAASTARTVGAVGGYRRVLFNEARLDPLSWPARLGTLAHELAHSMQYEWGGGRRGASDQWLREGFADWVAAHVLDRLGGLPLAGFRDSRRTQLQEMRPDRAPRLNEMATFPAWVELGARRDLRLYALAFLATDALITRHGVGTVVDYFRRFADGDDRLRHFRDAFGEDLASFEARVVPGLWRSGSAQDPETRRAGPGARPSSCRQVARSRPSTR